MKRMRILSPTAILGYGFPVESFERGMAKEPDVIAVDAGSTDPGPAYLGAGSSFVGRDAVKRDLEILLTEGTKHGVPVIIGTAGGSGSRVHVDRCLGILEEIARDNGMQARVAVIYSDVGRETVEAALKAGKVRPMPFAPPLTQETLARTTRIVAQIGVEPVIAALAAPVDVVVVGRCYDPAVFAALAVRDGFDEGLALHLGKILECGAIAAAPGSGRDCVLSDSRRFTVDSVAGHSLYEKAHPSLLAGPSGQVDLSQARFRQIDPTSVEVSGARFIRSERYAVKLEGAMRVGYRTICICGIRDPFMIAELEGTIEAVRRTVEDQFGAQEPRVNFRLYGRDGVMGPLEPETKVGGHEVGLVIDVVAPTQETADTVCSLARSTMLHYGHPGRIATAGNLAFPFSPSDIPVGEVYEFSVYHLMEIDDPVEMFPVERLTIGENR
jgi:hypothetical protein